MGGEWKLVPVDDASRSFADPLIPYEMVFAGMAAMERADVDLEKNTGPDWDAGMICVAIYRAMLAATPPPPSGSAWGVQVKWLEWALDPRSMMSKAGDYIIEDQGSNWTGGDRFALYFGGLNVGNRIGRYGDMSAAVQAANEHNEARILSALTPSPSYAEGIEAAAKVADDDTPSKFEGTLAAHVTGSTISREIRALAGKPPAEGGWLDISTVPTQPMGVELFYAGLPTAMGWSDDIWKGPRDERRTLGWWDGEAFFLNGTGHEADEGWRDDPPELKPTHWRALPAPPNVKVAP